MDSKLLRACLAELIGTFALVFVGGGVVCVAALTTEPRLDATAIALAEGLTLAVALTATHRASGGGLNPALTLMLWVFRRIDGRKLAGFIVAQLLGALLAGLFLRLLFSQDAAASHLGAPHLRAFAPNGLGQVSLGAIFSGVGMEIFFTCLVAFAFWATMLDRRSPPLGGLVVGLAQSAVVLFGFRLTGGAANPARWLGPAVFELTAPGATPSAVLSDHTVYWVGPIVGALLGGFLYVFVLQPPEEPEKR
ncbi:MAG TPA: MIP/aquaporin family protein [Gemmataceae bacterium]|nr:MIP/aquaporin family protein [Gemmataceae bacterium]